MKGTSRTPLAILLSALALILSVVISSAQAAAPLANRGGVSGSWHNPARDGEGLVLAQIDGRRILAYWFTYDQSGQQRWLVGQGLIEGRKVLVEDLWLTDGPGFGDGFDPDALQLTRFGSLLLNLTSCDVIEGHWQRSDNLDMDFGAAPTGELHLTRLTELATLGCQDQAEPITSLGWQAQAMANPGRVAYAAGVLHQGATYVAGGADAQGYRDAFARLDAEGQWQALPPLPEARIGGFLLGFGDALYFFGGSADTGFGGGPNCQALVCGELTGVGFRRRDAYRYDLATGHWSTLPDMPQAANMGGAAVLDGALWVLDGWTLNLLRFDPVTQQWSLRPGPATSPAGAPRAQSALVALDGELWLIGGRDYAGERREVYIYAPNQGLWREGPRLRAARAGHTATVVGGQLLVVGGEHWFGSGELITSAELYAAGHTGWLDLVSSDRPVHGAVGIGLENRLILIGGSTQARRAVPSDVLQSSEFVSATGPGG